MYKRICLWLGFTVTLGAFPLLFILVIKYVTKSEISISVISPELFFFNVMVYADGLKTLYDIKRAIKIKKLKIHFLQYSVFSWHEPQNPCRYSSRTSTIWMHNNNACIMQLFEIRSRMIQKPCTSPQCIWVNLVKDYHTLSDSTSRMVFCSHKHHAVSMKNILDL